MSIREGFRVLRGRQWTLDNGLETNRGQAGTVTYYRRHENTFVTITWDDGETSHVVHPGQNDILVFDCTCLGWLHDQSCDECNQPIRGFRWQCADQKCANYNVCSDCYHSNRGAKKHLRHQFMRYDGAGSTAAYRVTLLEPRKTAARVTVKGIFKKAQVVLDDKVTGTERGRVIAVNYDNNLQPQITVEWRPDTEPRTYTFRSARLKYVKPADGGDIYIDHLPVLWKIDEESDMYITTNEQSDVTAPIYLLAKDMEEKHCGQQETVTKNLCVRMKMKREAGAENELSFDEDDIITDVIGSGTGWWIGTLRGQTGLFPCVLVKNECKPPVATKPQPRIKPVKSSSPNGSSPRGVSSPKETSPQLSSPKETSPRVLSPKETSPQLSSPKETSPRVSSPKETSPRVSSPTKSSPQESRQIRSSAEASSPEWSPTASPKRKDAYLTTASQSGVNYKRTTVCVKMLCDYTADSVGELSFRCNDVIRDVVHTADGWWIGSIRGETGFFPSTFVKEEFLEDKIQDDVPGRRKPKVIITKPYTPESEGDLTCKQGDVITDVVVTNEYWWIGKLRGQTGLFPYRLCNMLLREDGIRDDLESHC